MFKEFSSVDELIEKSEKEPVLIYVHSVYCGISSAANEELERFMEKSKIDIYRVIIQTQKELSEEVGLTLKVHHETPQVIILKNKKVVYVASHFEIKGKKISEELKRIQNV